MKLESKGNTMKVNLDKFKVHVQI